MSASTASTTAACVGQPISWLRLEQLHLGEIEGAERAAIESHLGECPACRDCAQQIEREDAQVLAPLPAVATLPASSALPAIASPPRKPSRAQPLRQRWRWAALTLASAAAALFLVLPANRGELAVFPPPRIAVKGGELALSLVRERAGQISLDPSSFSALDRFKPLVTCPPPETLFVELAVYQEKEVSFPLAAGQAIACANQVPLSAFALTGTAAANVCVVTSPAPIDRGALRAGMDATLRPRSACVHLEPVR